MNAGIVLDSFESFARTLKSLSMFATMMETPEKAAPMTPATGFPPSVESSALHSELACR